MKKILFWPLFFTNFLNSIFDDSVWIGYSGASQQQKNIKSSIVVRNFGFNHFAVGANSEWIEFDDNGEKFFITQPTYLKKYFKPEFFHDFTKQVFYPNRIYKNDDPFDYPIVNRPKVTDKLIFSHQENQAEFGYGDAYFPGTGRCIFFALGNLLALQNVILNKPDFIGNVDYIFEDSGFYPFDIAAHNIFYLITQYPEWMRKNFPEIDRESLYDGIVSSGCDHFVKFYNAMISQRTTQSLETPYVLGFASEEEFLDIFENNSQYKTSFEVQNFLNKLKTNGRVCCLLIIKLNDDRHVICLDIDFNRKDSNQIIFRDSMRVLYKLPFWLDGKQYGLDGYVQEFFNDFWLATNLNQPPKNAPEEVREMMNVNLSLYKKISKELQQRRDEYLSENESKK